MSAKAKLAIAMALPVIPDPNWVVQLPQTFEPFRLRHGTGRFTANDFAALCAENPELRIEMTKEGEIIVMSPVTSEGGHRSFNLTVEFGIWAKRDRSGFGFDSSTGFTLPNGAERSPDIAWIKRNRWLALSETERQSFAPICPDFVVELRSKSDRLATLKDKLKEYLANGAQLGWLIDPLKKRVYVYRPGLPVEILDNPSEVSGDPLLKGFTLHLQGIID